MPYFYVFWIENDLYFASKTPIWSIFSSNLLEPSHILVKILNLLKQQDFSLFFILIYFTLIQQSASRSIIGVLKESFPIVFINL